MDVDASLLGKVGSLVCVGMNMGVFQFLQGPKGSNNWVLGFRSLGFRGLGFFSFTLTHQNLLCCRVLLLIKEYKKKPQKVGFGRLR